MITVSIECVITGTTMNFIIANTTIHGFTVIVTVQNVIIRIRIIRIN